MRLRRKIWQKQLRNTWQKLSMRRRKLQLIPVSICLLILVCYQLWPLSENYDTNKFCLPIDVVYTWVNGSDPEFIANVRRFDPLYDPARFDDKNELRYSLRSLEKYANWIRHVYIVTNGQIPNWLDLSYERVTVVPHELLAPDPKQLPTFSSAAIETFLHRIPKLSKRFLYMNDDIFLGAHIFPDDLYTEADGVRIYQAWMVPDCAIDCPWTYIGDGTCDHHCNIAECQLDGGDCSTSATSRSEENERMVEHDVLETATKLSQSFDPTPIRMFPKRKLFKKHSRHANGRNASTFKEMMRYQNLTTLNELRRVVDSFNNKLKSHGTQIDSSSPRMSTDAAPLVLPKVSYKSSKDIYSHSLIETNMLLNRIYGFKARNVLAHVGFLLDRDIVSAMQQKFEYEVRQTQSQRFRSSTDLQFAFAYYTFLMSETQTLTVEQIFDEFDTDGSMTWSDREVRTFLTRMYRLPLDWSAVHFFEEVVSNCSRDLGLDKREHSLVYTTLVYERYEDSNVPTITRQLVANCPLLAEALVSNFAVRSTYNYNINSKRATHSNFMMLTSNVTDVVDALDKMRHNPRKFNCINDNLEPQHSEDNELIRHLLEDFYLSFFPQRSKFELAPQYRNRFVNWHDYQRWRRRKRGALIVGYGVTILLIVFLLQFLCVHKAKFVRRCVQNL